ncbi:uncharacterized protein LOC129750015 [Uranotaenia lowii]|uniref:uncharacterized protein LOC129750015 n=1 Tax=Uranotaenia lowii TaxID=190385 RepID=UPI00247AA313|nr:uncharacterized protein LOC129750015 [Uranotaenia lowii]
MLADGVSANSLDENIRIGESTALVILKKFCTAVIDVYAAEYLRTPTHQDRDRLMKENANRGFTGMLGSIDCVHWLWKNCPVALKGQYQGEAGNPTIVLEAVASRDGYIWHSFYGCPGSCNDLNEQDRSSLLSNILQKDFIQGTWTACGKYSRIFFSRWKYPNLPIFLKHFHNHKTPKRSILSNAKKLPVRMSNEHLPAGLEYSKCRLWDAKFMKNIIFTCIILHDMRLGTSKRDSLSGMIQHPGRLQRSTANVKT